MFEDLYFDGERRNDDGFDTFPMMFLMAFCSSNNGLANAMLEKNSKERF